jgi:two-component system chemotaxis response regulator CheY
VNKERRSVTKTILTVDDSRMMREMLLMSLRDAGFNVVQAEDGLDGLSKLADAKPDVIITDINMPRMDGFGFIEGVRRDARFRATPILVLSTESDAAKKARARDAGATGWIVKPFNTESLVSAIRRVSA